MYANLFVWLLELLDSLLEWILYLPLWDPYIPIG
jgi:hypothetical protein